MVACGALVDKVSARRCRVRPRAHRWPGLRTIWWSLQGRRTRWSQKGVGYVPLSLAQLAELFGARSECQHATDQRPLFGVGSENTAFNCGGLRAAVAWNWRVGATGARMTPHLDQAFHRGHVLGLREARCSPFGSAFEPRRMLS